MVLVVSKNNKPLMPTGNYKKVRRLLRENKAKVISQNPFTIKLLKETTENVQPLHLGIDPGRQNIGYSVINEQGTNILSGTFVTRNKEIPKLMVARKQNRQKHRRFRRQKQQRRAVKNKTCFTVKERFLPHYKKPVTLHYIKNKEARYCNRKRKKGWLTPTARHLKQTHKNLILKLSKFLPISNVSIELNKFSFMDLENPNLQKWQYSKGVLYRSSIKESLKEIQSNHCLLCKQAIEHYHHIVPIHLNGSNTLDNLVGLCSKCHKKVHTDEKIAKKIETKRKGLHKKYHHLSILNRIIPSLIAELLEIYKTKLYVTTGLDTAAQRREYNIEKTHSTDAYMIALMSLQQKPLEIELNPKIAIEMKQYRRHKRNAIHQENLNRVYYIDSIDETKKKPKIIPIPIAYNRNRAYEQKQKSLSEIKDKLLIQKLKVKEHKPKYLQKNKVQPGAILPEGVLQGTDGSENGHPKTYVLTTGKTISYKKGKILKQNTGLVFL